jgi:hypothetical protein
MHWPDNMTLVDAVMAFTVAEGLALLAWRMAMGSGPALPDIATTLLPGLCLMLALRSAVSASAGAGANGLASTPWLAPWLVAAGAAHAVDVWRRWPSSRPRPATSAH